ncbi:hypothetical protein [Kitasatospora camelliae]|uniref:HEAT repeat protein n=1 Tax=Kitasatospora camelliae TaxID=3156397 RepID=A0AAU8K411_9ACTN
MDEALAASDPHPHPRPDPSRTALLAEVRADRTGPAAALLLRLARSPGHPLRRPALALLEDLTLTERWPEAVAAARDRLTDPDPEVRRQAAQTARSAGRGVLPGAVLDGVTDPAARTLLAEALHPADLAGRRDDPLASVRFLAHLAALQAADPAARPELDAALLADVQEASRHLTRTGRRWGWTLYGLRREQHTYALAARLLADPATREVGADLTRAACHGWRAAPVALMPLLLRHAGPRPGPRIAAALRTASISRAAMDVHGGAAAAVAFTPYERGRPAACAPVPRYDRDGAAALLAAKPVGVARLAHAPAVFGALLDAGPLTFRQAAQLHNLAFLRPGRMQALCAPLWLRHAGPAALPRLLALLTPHLDEYGIGGDYLAALGRIGPSARPALPAVEAVIDRRTRIPVNDSTRDAETELDERLLAAAQDARRAILGPPSPAPQPLP